MNQNANEMLVYATAVCVGLLGTALYLAYRLHVALTAVRAARVTPVPSGAVLTDNMAVGGPPAFYQNHRILITDCSDPMLWYSDMVGKEVPYLGTWFGDGIHKSREPAGFINVVRDADAVIIKYPSKGQQ